MVSDFRRLLLALALCGFTAQCQANCGPAYGADGIAEDASGHVWLTHYEDVRVSRIEADSGKFTEFLPTTHTNLEVTTRKKGSASKQRFDYSYDTGFSGIGLDEQRGYVWTFRWNSNTLTRFSQRDQQFKDFQLPGSPFTRGTIHIDTHGHLWVLISDQVQDMTTLQVVEVSPDGEVLRQATLPHREYASYALALDGGGKLWLAQSARDEAAPSDLYTLEGHQFIKQPAHGLGHLVTSMIFDQAGNLWLTNHDQKTLGKLTNGKLTTISLPDGSGSPGGALVDGHGNLWFTEYMGDGQRGKIGRLSTDGTLNAYDVPPEDEWVVSMNLAKDGGIWFSTILNYSLYHLDPETGKIREYALPVPGNWLEEAAAHSSTCKIAPKIAAASEATQAVPTMRHPRGYPGNSSAVLFERSCTRCHSWYRVEKVSARRSDWSATVDRMIYANGAKFITPLQRNKIIHYLNRNYSAKGAETAAIQR